MTVTQLDRKVYDQPLPLMDLDNYGGPVHISRCLFPVMAELAERRER